ncbi:MAG: biotin--[acetyl-CoA-carboxylase] ligase, partial [Cupriavidus sp.]|nr:biotin--[acetyl-CoA-carboxylase] ligase [Cupriavidus sp.]
MSAVPPNPPDPSVAMSWRIDAGALRAMLSPALRDWTLELVEETGSTNADLTARCRQSPWSDAGTLRLAYRQTAGRGRQGRPWQGQAGMTFSVALPL